jgi:predicted acylesterase/phospholipase RssA
MSVFGSRLKHVTCRTWDATQRGFSFPEYSDPELAALEFMKRPNLGVAFSGGGSRAASATLGQIRGLRQIGILDKIRYFSTVSGSSFVTIPFTYLPDSWTDKTFLGPVIPPENLTLEHLLKTDRNSSAHTIANSVFIDDFSRNMIRLAGDETVSRMLGDVFLNPFGLEALRTFFSYDQKTVSAILERNPPMKGSDFHQVRRGRPLLIVNALILRPDNSPPLPTRIPLETTPLYVGVRPVYRGAGSYGRDIGGGYVQPFGFDSEAPDEPPDAASHVRVRLGATRHRYTLSDMMGATCAAPAEILTQAGLNFIGFPEFRYWPLVGVGDIAAKEYEIGDGGILENLGIMPLLARKVKNIIVFVNTKDELRGGGLGLINTSIPPLFGQTPGFETNHVFPASQYQKLVEGLLAAKEVGQTVMFRDRYTVMGNAHHGIQGGWEANILWVYNERVPAWEQRLPQEIRRWIGLGSLANFPHYRTFFQNPPAVVDLSAKQTQMLAHLSCWNVISNAERFHSMLSV